MADTIRELFIELGVKADDRGLVRMEVGLQHVKRGMQTVLRTTAAFAAGVAATTGLLVMNANAVAANAREIQMLSDMLNLTTHRSQQLLYTFSQFGGDADDVADALGTLADRAQDAMDGSASYAEDFALIGLAVDDLRGKDPMQLFELMTDGLAKQKDVTKAVAAAYRIFGDDVGRKLKPLLQTGTEGLKEFMQTFDDLGVAINAKGIRDLDAWKLELGKLGLMAQSVRNMLAMAFVPVLNDVAKAMTIWFKRNKEIIQQRFEDWGERARRSVDRLLISLEKLNKYVEKHFGGWPGIFEKAGKALTAAFGARVLFGVTQAVGGLAVALNGLGVALSAVLASFGFAVTAGGALGLVAVAFVTIAGWIAQVVAVLGVLYLLWEDFTVFLRGGDSVIGRIIDLFIEQDKVAKALNDTFAALKELGLALWGVFKAIGLAILSLVIPAMKMLWVIIEPIWDVLKEFGKLQFTGLISLLETVTSALNAVSGNANAYSTAQGKASAGLTESMMGPRTTPQPMFNYDTRNSNYRGGNLVVQGHNLSERQLAELKRRMDDDDFNRMLRDASAQYQGGRQ